MTREVVMPTSDEMLTVQELAELLKVPVSTVYAWRYTGYGPRGIRVGRYVRYRHCDIEAFLEECAANERV
jgi:excisionase family DNA binding protein